MQMSKATYSLPKNELTRSELELCYVKNSLRRKLPETSAKSISLRFHSQFRTFEVGQKFQY